MNAQIRLLIFMCILLLVACGGGAAEEAPEFAMEQAPAATAASVEEAAEEIAEPVEAEVVMQPTAALATPAPAGVSPALPVVSQQRMIIKDGQMTIVAQDTETAVNRVSLLVVEVGGYIISQQVYDDPQGYRYATMRLAVPVDRFEETLQTLRTLGQVTNESASGVDVTDEFVDLNSRLENLQATRARLLTFLEQATTVEQTLKVNEELKVVEEEIAVIQGRINYLRDRASFSTIDLTINPWIPTPTPTATATVTPTPTPTSLPQARDWQPGETVYAASVQLRNTAQTTADFALYNVIVCGPWVLMLLLVAYPMWRVYRRVVSLS